MPPDYRIAPERHAGSPPTGMASLVYGLLPSLREDAFELLRTPRMDAVGCMGDRVIVKSFGVETAGQL
jgi:hypothetical protein